MEMTTWEQWFYGNGVPTNGLKISKNGCISVAHDEGAVHQPTQRRTTLSMRVTSFP